LTSQVVCQCYFWPLNGCWRSAMNLWEEFSTPVVLTNMISCKCQWRGDRIPIPLETCSIFKLQFKNSLSNVFSHLHIIMNSAKTEQNPPQNSIWLQGISLIIISTSCRWPAWPRRSTMQVYQFCRNHVNCAHKIKTMLAFIHQICMVQADRRQTKVISSGCTPSSHIWSKWLCYHACVYPPIMAFHETTSRDSILFNTLRTSSLLPHLTYM
jgi:hypothetical protein